MEWDEYETGEVAGQSNYNGGAHNGWQMSATDDEKQEVSPDTRFLQSCSAS